MTLLLVARNNLYVAGLVPREDPKRGFRCLPLEQPDGTVAYPDVTHAGPLSDHVFDRWHDPRSHKDRVPFTKFYASHDDEFPSVSGGNVYEHLLHAMSPHAPLRGSLEDKIGFLCTIEHVLDELFGPVCPGSTEPEHFAEHFAKTLARVGSLSESAHAIMVAGHSVVLSVKNLVPDIAWAGLQIGKGRKCDSTTDEPDSNLYTEFTGLSFSLELAFSRG